MQAKAVHAERIERTNSESQAKVQINIYFAPLDAAIFR
jgi:hypothetical protein